MAEQPAPSSSRAPFEELICSAEAERAEVCRCGVTQVEQTSFSANTYVLTTENQVNRGEVTARNPRVHQHYENLCISQNRLLTNVSSRYNSLGGKSEIGFIWFPFS